MGGFTGRVPPQHDVLLSALSSHINLHPEDEDFHRTGSRFEPEGERARQAAGEDYGRPAGSEYAAEQEFARTA